MIVVIVSDVFISHGNGTSISAQRLAEGLLKRGHQVRVITTGEEGENLYICKSYEKGLIPAIGRGQGIRYGKVDEKVIRRALDGADLVHCYLPFPLERRTVAIAKELGIPVTAGFHVQPENITYNLGCSSCSCCANMVYYILRGWFYRSFNHIHCPSQFIADELARHNYKASLHVISNGVIDLFRPISVSKLPEFKDRICILMVGRLSKEKRQSVLIKACMMSKYANRIQLFLAGKGPKEESYRQLGQTMPNPAVFGFYSQEDLCNLINMCDLYVHAADVEIEAISCIEAFSCGLVPIICNSNTSATRQFALCDNCLFKPNDIKDLASKIDYWIEHPEEKKAMGAKYIDYSKQFRIDACIDSMVDMFQEAIQDKKALSSSVSSNKQTLTLHSSVHR